MVSRRRHAYENNLRLVYIVGIILLRVSIIQKKIFAAHVSFYLTKIPFELATYHPDANNTYREFLSHINSLKSPPPNNAKIAPAAARGLGSISKTLSAAARASGICPAAL